MLYNLLFPLADDISVFNLFRYITLRTGGATVTALFVSFVLGPMVIRWLKSKQAEGQPIREDGPPSHLITKKGTPTMGGVLILFALGIATLLWADLTNEYVWAVLLVTIGFGAIGFIDDFKKLTKRSSDGLSGRVKLVLQIIIGGAATIWITAISEPQLSNGLAIPFVKDFLVPLGWFFLPWAIIVMVTTLTAPSAPPMASEPVSPMNTMAGGALNHRKPSPAPTRAPQNTASSPEPRTKWICR